MRVVVTGASGFVGGYIAQAVRQVARETVVVSRNPAFRLAGTRTTCGDLTDPDFAKTVLNGATHVIHCAGEKVDTRAMMAGNVTSTQNLLDAAKPGGLKTFVLISSVGVIGKSGQRVIDELTPCAPMNFYEETKLRAEQLVRNSGLQGVILRPTNVFGRETMPDWKATSLMRLRIRGGENAHLVYVKDVAAAAVFAACRETSGMETFIVSSDDEPGNTVAEVLSRITDRDVPLCAPLWIPYMLRRLRHGQSNWGGRLYSAGKLFDAGFSRPYGLAEGLNRSLENRDQGSI